MVAGRKAKQAGGMTPLAPSPLPSGEGVAQRSGSSSALPCPTLEESGLDLGKSRGGGGQVVSMRAKARPPGSVRPHLVPAL